MGLFWEWGPSVRQQELGMGPEFPEQAPLRSLPGVKLQVGKAPDSCQIFSFDFFSNYSPGITQKKMLKKILVFQKM
jgi:hypothetical protein